MTRCRYFLERRNAWGDVLWAVLEGDRVLCRCTDRADALTILDALKATSERQEAS